MHHSFFYGVLDDGEVKYAIKIPYALSILAHGVPSAEVIGLDQFPEDEIPPLYIHYLFDIMVLIGMWMIMSFRRVLDRDETTLEDGDDQMVPLANRIRWTVVNHSDRSRMVACRSRQAAVDSKRLDAYAGCGDDKWPCRYRCLSCSLFSISC